MLHGTTASKGMMCDLFGAFVELTYSSACCSFLGASCEASVCGAPLLILDSAFCRHPDFGHTGKSFEVKTTKPALPESIVQPAACKLSSKIFLSCDWDVPKVSEHIRLQELQEFLHHLGLLISGTSQDLG